MYAGSAGRSRRSDPGTPVCREEEDAGEQLDRWDGVALTRNDHDIAPPAGSGAWYEICYSSSSLAHVHKTCAMWGPH